MPLNNKSTGFDKMKRKTEPIVIWRLVIVLTLLIITSFTACRSLYTGDACVCCIDGPHPILGGWIAADPQFLWMPTGNEILFQNQIGEIYLVHVDERGSRKPDQLVGIIGFQPDVTRDGQLLAVSTSEHLVKIFSLPDLRQVEFISDAVDPTWRPDSQVLAIRSLNSRDYDLVSLVNIDNPDQRTLVAGSRRQSYYIEEWSRDGNYLVLTTTEPDPVATGLAEKLYVLSIDSGNIAPLINLPGCQDMLSWSSFDNQIVFAANPDHRWDLFQIELGSDEVRNLINTPDEQEYQPEWSPDGNVITYVTFEQKSDSTIKQDIYVVNVTTLEKQRLTKTVDEHESLPRWSPDGSRIAYLSVLDNVWYLNIMKSDGTGQRRLAIIDNHE